MEPEFVIPLHFRDLELAAGGRMCVSDVLPVEDWEAGEQQAGIKVLESSLLEDVTTALEQEHFDSLYSFARHFTSMSQALQLAYVRAVSTALELWSRAAREAAASRLQGGDRSDAQRLRSALQLLVCTGAHAVAEAIGVAAPATKKGEGKRARAAHKPQLFNLLAKALQTTLDSQCWQVWPSGLAPEDVGNLYLRLLYKALESKELCVQAAEPVAKFGCTVLAKFGAHSSDWSTHMLQCMKVEEEGATLVAQIVCQASASASAAGLDCTLLREVCRIKFCESRDAAGVRNVCTFIKSMAELRPGAVLACIASLLPHLDSSSASVRSAVIGALAFVMDHAAAEAQSSAANAVTARYAEAADAADPDVMASGDIDDAARAAEAAMATGDGSSGAARTLQALQDLLHERVHDVNAYARVAALRAWQLLAERRHIPVARMEAVARLAAQRMCDKAALVRKAALQLCVALVEGNPFMARLDAALFARKVEEAMAALQEVGGVAEAEAEAAAADAANAQRQRQQQERKRRRRQHKRARAVDGSDESEAEEAEAEEAEEGSEEEEDSDALSEEGAGAEEAGAEGGAPDAAAADIAAPATSADVAARRRQGLLRLMRYYRCALGFAAQLDAATETAGKLLGSQQATDVQGALRLLLVARRFNVGGSGGSMHAALRKMLVLVWSEAAGVVEDVITTFQAVHVQTPEGAELPPVAVAGNLARLAQQGTFAERASLEQVIKLLTERGALHKAVPKQLLRATCEAELPLPVRVGACVALGACASAGLCGGVSVDACCATVSQAVRECASGAADDVTSRWRDTMAREAFRLLLSVCAARKCAAPAEALQSVHQYITAALCSADAAGERAWFGACQSAVQALATLSARPDAELEAALRAAASALLQAAGRGGVDVPAAQLGRALFVAGQVALRLCGWCEDVANQAKRLRAAREEAQSKATAAAKGAGGEAKARSTDEELEMDVVGAADDTEELWLRDVTDSHLVQRNLVGLLCPLAARIIGTPASFPDPALRVTAASALCAFMCVSEQFCGEQLQLLFTVLRDAPEAEIRTNCMVAVGDLTVRFPNLLEPWTSHIFARLRDTDVSVRKSALGVVSHLILNNMVKVKGYISGVAVCLVDKDARVRDLASLFFTELSKRGNNPVYNALPDIISSLSHDEAVDSASFKKITGFLMKFVQKDRQTESLARKMCQRFKTTTDVEQARNLAHCLAMLSITDKHVPRLVEAYPAYKTFLADAVVMRFFREVASKAKRFARAQFKDAIVEFESKLAEAEGKEGEGGAVAGSAAAGSAAAGSAAAGEQGSGAEEQENVRPAAAKRGRKPAAAGRARKGAAKPARRRRAAASSESEGEAASPPSDSEEDAAPKRAGRRNAARATKRQAAVVAESAEEDMDLSE